MMMWQKRNFSIILFLLLWIVCMTESRYRDKERKREKLSNRQYSQPQQNGGIGGIDGASIQASMLEQPNLCSRERDRKLICYCTPESHIPSSTVKADCWIFQKDFHQNDTIWNAFYQQKSLRDLKFTVQTTGSLDYIPTAYIKILHNLTSFTIEYSQILIVKSYAFGNLQNLETITLINNQIEIIDENAFVNHVLLKELHLQNNQITEIDRYAFRNLPLLITLNLNHNNLTSLHEELFGELIKLENLNLGHNQISVITADIFKGLENLKNLKLTHNNLNFIGDTVFAELWSLQILDLDDNQIERIAERALDGLNNLKTLNLRNNRLKKLDNGLLRGTPALQSINLQDNLLETLTYYNFQPIMDNLVNGTSELSVSDNKLTCDCRLQWIFDLRNRTKNTNFKNSLEDIECILYDGKASSSSSHHQVQKSHAGHSKSLNDDLDVDGTSSSEIMMNVIKEKLNDHQHQQQHQTIYGYGHGGGGGGDVHHRQHNSQRNTFNNKKLTDFETDLYYDNQAEVGTDGVYQVHGGVGGGGGTNADLDDFEITGGGGGTSSGRSGIIGGTKILKQTRGLTKLQKRSGHMVTLLKLKPESLPCPEELSDPTELPLSRESIGMTVRGNSFSLGPQVVFVMISVSISTILNSQQLLLPLPLMRSSS